MSRVPTQLVTERLLLRAPSVAMAAAVCDYQLRNREHFSRWDPPYPADYFEREATAERLAHGEQAFAEGSGYRYWFSLRENPAHLIGQANLSQVARAAFQNAMLGYSLDAQVQGAGLMHEALRAIVAQMFAAPVRLHRIQAAVRPENQRSRAVLQRLGFEREGLSRRYLFIHGAWRDHEVFALLNPGWPVDQAPPV